MKNVSLNLRALQATHLRTLAWIGFAVMAVAVLAWAQINRAEAQSYDYHTVDSTLSIGMNGQQVRNLQRLLAADPLVYPEGLVTGYFGPLTRKAVVNFQIGYDLPPVGAVGPLTKATLNTVVNNQHLVDVSAPQINTVTVSNTSSTAVSVAWTTNEVARGKVFFSTAPISIVEFDKAKVEPFISGEVVSDSAFGVIKSMALPNLLANRTYYYVIVAIDAEGNVSITRPALFSTGN
ncbi:hypothetical protein EPO17_01250 [Patescibacteria group bacterium]|nr:MAG: hypothetical protein EPO17_01250 [Patescibacteria group bacterium]